MLRLIIKFILFLTSIPVTTKLLHLYQLKDYQNGRYLNSIRYCFAVILFSVLTLIFHILKYNIFYLITIINLLINIFLLLVLPKSKKTPLKYTDKAKRILFLQIIICLASVFCIYTLVLFEIVLLFSPIIAKEINIYDKIKNHIFLHHAIDKLKSMKARVIAITGSNGKTSVKNILSTFLNVQYKTVCTPASFNTPLGIAKFINTLEEKCDIVILEFGARRVGDISKLCKLFSPDFGIVSMVGNQHLATFKNYENIYKTKAELSRYLNEKPCVYNLDNLGTNAMFCEKTGTKIGISLHKNISSIYADNILIKNGKTKFDLVCNQNIYACSTNMLGKHNITNILLSFAMSISLGVDEKLLVDKISRLESIPHRLNLIKTDIYILDDTYNCSLSSAMASLEVLSQMPNKKMIVTPGIIEGGKFEYNINENLGKMLSKFDYIVVVGRHNKESLLSGLCHEKNDKKILLASTIDDAKQYFKILNKNDTLLLLNDLPDDYN